MKSAIEKITLGNGLTVLLENIPHRTSATVGLWLPVGSRFETKKESGFSHFVEHMLFKGTKKRHYTELSRAIDRLGGHMNASTSKEITDYYISLSGRYLPIALDVLSDMFFDSLFSKDEFESEKKVIVEELKMGEDQPDDFLFDLFYEYQVGDNSLGRPIAGKPSGIARATRDDLYAYYCTHYGPEGAVLSEVRFEVRPDGMIASNRTDAGFQFEEGFTGLVIAVCRLRSTCPVDTTFKSLAWWPDADARQGRTA